MDKLKKFILDANNKKILIVGISVIILIVIIILLVSLFGTTYSISDNVSIDEVNSIIDTKENGIIYVLDSSSDSEYNTKILSYLDDNNISYDVYDISKVDDTEYKELLDTLDIDSEIFGCPAIIYIQEGVMFANIININDLSVVERFIQDYDLKVLR